MKNDTRNGVVVFTAFEPDELEVNINAWLANHPDVEVGQTAVTTRKAQEWSGNHVSDLPDQLVFVMHYWEVL